MTDFSAGWDGASGVAIQADGRIVVVGAAGQRHDDPKFVLARYNSNGTLDASFGVNGKVETDFTAWGDEPTGWRSRRTGGSSPPAGPTAGRTRWSRSPDTWPSDCTSK